MLKIFQSLNQNYFEAKETKEKTQFHVGVEELDLEEGKIASTYAPILGDSVDFTLLNLSQDIYLSKLDFSATIVEGNVLSKFGQISVSSMDENYMGKNHFFELFKKIVKVKHDASIVASEDNTQLDEILSQYIVVSQRNSFLASYDYPSSCQNPEFYGETLFFQKVKNLQKFKAVPAEYRLIFFQLCKDYFVPVVAKKSDSLKSLLIGVTKLVNDHGYELKEEQIMQSTEFNGEKVDWNDEIERFYKNAAELQASKFVSRKRDQAQAEKKENAFIDQDGNSRMAVMFTFDKSVISVGPSFNKTDYPQQINLKITLGQLLGNIIKQTHSYDQETDQQQSLTIGESLEDTQIQSNENHNNKIEKFVNKHLQARYVGVHTIHHSLKMDLLSGLKLTASQITADHKNVAYSPFAFLLKSYGGYELVKFDKATREGYSVGTKAVIKEEEILEKQVAILYLKRDD